MTRGEAIAARARALIGVRFRPQGRSAGTGLDCIGLVAAAVEAVSAERAYSLHGDRIADVEAGLRGAGLQQVEHAVAGDILVMRAGPQQLHLAVKTQVGFVHAHAGLRRVVEAPGEPEWPVLSRWRLEGERA